MSTQSSQADQPASVSPAGPAPVRITPAAPAPAAPAGPNNRVKIIAGLIVLAALGAGGRMWYRSHNFVETENAYVAGHVHPVSSPRCLSTTTRW